MASSLVFSATTGGSIFIARSSALMLARAWLIEHIPQILDVKKGTLSALMPLTITSKNLGVSTIAHRASRSFPSLTVIEMFA